MIAGHNQETDSPQHCRLLVLVPPVVLVDPVVVVVPVVLVLVSS